MRLRLRLRACGALALPVLTSCSAPSRTDVAAGEHEGWQRFERTTDKTNTTAACQHATTTKYLFRYLPDGEWHLNSGVSQPDTPIAASFPRAYIEAADGTLPVGEQLWNVVVDGKYCDMPLTISLQT